MALSCLQRLEAEPTRACGVAANASFVTLSWSGLAARQILRFSGRAGVFLSQHFRGLVFLAVCFHFALGAANVRAQGPAEEIKKKAGFLKLFRDYTKWPPGEGDSFKLGILGQDSFGDALDSLNPKRSANVQDLKDCQMIFISKSEAARIPAILAALEGLKILTVGETEGFAKEGGMIGFVLDDDKKLRFEINTGPARRSGISFDLRLLRMPLRLFNN